MSDEVSTFASRMIEARTDAGLTQSSACRKLGITPSTLSSIENGGSKSSRHLTGFARIYNVSPHWLATGRGPKRIDENVEPAEFATKTVPLVNYVQAGQFSYMGNGLDTTSMRRVRVDTNVSDTSFALKIRGDSMAPEFTEGDLVIIDCAIEPRSGDYVVARNDHEEATFKKYRLLSTVPTVFELVPLNSMYASIRSDLSHVSVIGVMVEHHRYRKM